MTKKKSDTVEEVTNPLDSITGKYFVKSVRKTWLNSLDPSVEQGRIFDRAIYSYTVEYDHELRGAVKTGLTIEEQEAFENALAYKKGALSPFNLKRTEKDSGDFSWADFRITIPSAGITLDADRSILDKLRVKVLMSGSKVATSTSEYEISPVRYELLMVSKDAEAKISKKNSDQKKRAYLKFSDMSIQDMMDFLSVYEEGRFKASADATPDWIEGQVSKIVDSEPKKFSELVDSPTYKTMIFIFRCINRNALYRQGSKYMTFSGEVLGNSLAEAVTNLQSDDYQGLKISLQTKLDDSTTTSS